MLTGGCFCGRLRYEADAAPFNQSGCHCSICRRTTGAPFVACTQIVFELDAADEIDVNTCSLDEPAGVAPLDHIYTASRLEWVELADGLPQFRASRAEG